jgi:hypothetical protein
MAFSTRPRHSEAAADVEERAKNIVSIRNLIIDSKPILNTGWICKTYALMGKAFIKSDDLKLSILWTSGRLLLPQQRRSIPDSFDGIDGRHQKGNGNTPYGKPWSQ